MSAGLNRILFPEGWATGKREGAMAHTDEIKCVGIHELNRNPNNVDIGTSYTRRRRSGQSLVSTLEIISWKFVFRSLMDSAFPFRALKVFHHDSVVAWPHGWNFIINEGLEICLARIVSWETYEDGICQENWSFLKKLISSRIRHLL